MSGVRSFLSALAHGLGAGLTRRRISSEAKLVEFVATRAAHVAQTALFGYLTTRMGTPARERFSRTRSFRGRCARHRTVSFATVRPIWSSIASG